MGVFSKLFKISELIYGTSGTGNISPLAETESIPVKCTKKALNYFSSHPVLSDSSKVTGKYTHNGTQVHAGDNCLFVQTCFRVSYLRSLAFCSEPCSKFFPCRHKTPMCLAL